MDVAKYISLYLFKTGQCSVERLGTFKLEKRSAEYVDGKLTAPSQTITLSREETDVEGLLNFIAKNEHISTEQVAAQLRDFSLSLHKELSVAGEARISHLGKLTEDSGQVTFTANPNLLATPEPITVQRSEVSNEEYTTEDTNYGDAPAEKKGSNAGVIILVIVLLIALAAGGYYWYVNYYQKDNNTVETIPAEENNIPAADSTDVDTLEPDEPAPPPPVTVKDGVLNMKAVINKYNNIQKAKKREKQLSSYGMPVRIRTKDSSEFYIVLPVQTTNTDKQAVLDSLSNNYNPNGVTIFN